MARKILLADDSVTAQNMGRKILADAGYEVITVNNGSAALKKIAELKPEIIILDVYMPGYSGLEVCQRLKEAQETSRVPVLLTVGKLEPFKPEEAKRVRAEGYIVKPFEASELLSALSKLEDKIVPRAEASKPGRFARANAALDEGRYDKSVSIEEDSGWKNRIGFPSKKKNVEEAESDDSSIYNAVNKDLRTVMDRPPAPQPNESRGEESRIDLGALASEGLPKDVTPEEIAALAAAAAQVQGKLAEPVAENLPELPAAMLPGVKVAEVPAPEAKLEPTPVAELTKESEKPAATFAAQKPEEAVSAKVADAVKESDVPVPSPAEMMAAIAGLVPEVDKSSDSNSGDESRALTERVKKDADEPVTMAAAGVSSAGVAPRWTAVAVALAPEEASLSLEHEMQKAYAAFAAAEVAHVHAPAAEVVPAVVESVSAQQISTVEVVAETVVPAVAEVQTRDEVATKEATQIEAAQSFGPVSSPSHEVVAAAVREFDRVAASFEARPHAAGLVPSEPGAASAQAVAQVSQPAPDSRAIVEPVGEPVVTAAVPEQASMQSEPASESAKESTWSTALEEQKAEESKQEDAKYEAPKYDESKPEEPGLQAKQEESKHEEAKQEAVLEVEAVTTPVEELAAPVSEKLESASPVVDNNYQEEPISVSPAATHAVEAVAATEPAAEVSKGAAKDPANKESEIAETTAAAWASWRRIRESGDGKSTQHSEKHAASKDEKSVTQDAAARAVAAGAEKSPEDPAPSEESPEIASIVDSVLAGMRPRIVEEISRKLGKK